VDNIFRELGKIMWEFCGMTRNAKGLEQAMQLIQSLRAEFWENVLVPGTDKDFNKSLEKAGRLADSLEFAETMVVDALTRDESCGSHFRTEFQTEDGEARRDDENFCHVSIWEYQGEEERPAFHKEPLVFENVELSQRSYK
jgi:succinate dehydrogenase / fumarate reductase, flavoprotein subunit